MRVLLDQDVAIQALEPLRHVLKPHEVEHIYTVKWAGKKDRFVFADAAKDRFDVIVTKDVGQLSDPDECTALKRSGLHHVTYTQAGDGLDGLGRALGAIFAAMPGVMRDLEGATSQQLVTITSIGGGRRHELRDPAGDPPPYWPR